MADANLQVVVSARDDAHKTISSIGGAFSDLGNRLKRDVTYGALAAGTAIVGFSVSSVKAAMESAQATAQLNAVLKSTGGVAGITADEVLKFSNEMKKLTGVSDEAMTSTQSMMLTFTNIGKDIFPIATKAALDMATAMNGGVIPNAEELRNQTIQLGKALQDPDAGLGALKRVGVNVDELSAKFTDSMTTQEKQRLILQELNTEFGGSAEAAGETFAGAVNKLREAIGDLQEEIGTFIIEYLRDFVERLRAWAQDPSTEIKLQNLMDKFSEWGVKIVEATKWLNEHRTIAYALGFVVLALAASMGTVGAAFLLVAGTIYAVYRAGKETQGAMNDFKNLFVSYLEYMKVKVMQWAAYIIEQYLRVKNTLIGGWRGSANIPGLPFFQEGGIMPHTGLAFLHQGERVLPSAISGGGGGGNITVIINGGINNNGGLTFEEIEERLHKTIINARTGVV